MRRAVRQRSDERYGGARECRVSREARLGALMALVNVSVRRANQRVYREVSESSRYPQRSAVLFLPRSKCPSKCPRHPVVAQRRGNGRERVGRSFLFPLSPFPWNRGQEGERRGFGPLVFLVKIPCPWHSGSPGPSEPSHWPLLVKKQFQRTILGPLLIPASATPGRPSRFWLETLLGILG
jgi:hypothetical protein